MDDDQNVDGGELQPCSVRPMTGFYRDGCCKTGPEDLGSHTVCAVMTQDFLDYTKEMGNDLSTPRPEYQFPGLRPGDRWCVCAARWQEAANAGVAPKVVLSATHQHATRSASEAELRSHAVDETRSENGHLGNGNGHGYGTNGKSP